MAQPVIWSQRPFFYPVGNTPPTSFTRDLSLEENGEILLLGCGDPRSILYTIHTDLGADNRMLDFTCCDAEPAIISRNLLLLTLIIDGISTIHAWRIFYHFYLDDDSLRVLLSQCRLLVKSASNVQVWNGSKYGKYLRFCTIHTLAEIRRHWQLYLDTDSIPEREKKKLRSSFVSGMAAVRAGYGGLAISKGHLNRLALEAGVQSYTSFWKLGLTTSNSSNHPSAQLINPTFAYSLAGRTFNVHYATDPIKSFHLIPTLTLSSPFKTTAKDLTESAMQQFSAWCFSFQQRVLKGPSLVIRFFAGDCMSFCRALNNTRMRRTSEAPLYGSVWGLSKIQFGEDYSLKASAPFLFNVIDTSNLTNHLGLLNILLATVPLLQQDPWAVLHTNSFMRSNPIETGGLKSVLVDNTFSDIPTLSLLLGVAPTSRLFRFTAHPYKHELPSSGGQYHESVMWKRPVVIQQFPVPFSALKTFPPILICDEQRLGAFLFSVYLQMFAEESIEGMLKLDLSTIYRQYVVYYTRPSFVALLALIKDRVDVDWTKCMTYFIELLERDRVLSSSINCYQDLICHLYLSGLHVLQPLRWDMVKTLRQPNDCFRGWKDVPPVVCVVLKVPRQNLRDFEAMGSEKLLMPILHCETRGRNSMNQQTQNIHSLIHPTFGDITVSRTGGETRVVIKEDEQRWKGNSSLIVIFDIPSWLLTDVGNVKTVGLNLRSTPGNIHELKSKFKGLDFTIYSTFLTDEEHVQILRRRPNELRDICRPNDSPLSTASNLKIRKDNHKALMNFDGSGSRAISLTIREVIKDPEAAKSLADGASVTAKAIADSAMLVSYEGYEHIFSYPYPIRSTQSKTRVARKSSYIEIESPIRPDFSSSAEVPLNLFPIAKTSTSFNLINIHYLKLDSLPALERPISIAELGWLSTHLGMTPSEYERIAQRDTPNLCRAEDKRSMPAKLTESIATIITTWTRLNLTDASHKTISLSDIKRGPYALIFLNVIRLDLSSSTLAVDACIIPFTADNSAMLNNLMRCNSGQELMELFTLEDETKAWRSLLPAFAERCRTWKHTDKCEYQINGIPACGDLEGISLSPLCSCGRGKDLGAFGTMKDWKVIHSEATRVAISPLFSFSFMEKTMKEMMDDLKASMSKKEAAPSGGSSSPGTCAQCSAPGKPKLLICSACKKTEYCSQECQKRHWRVHKLQCGK